VFHIEQLDVDGAVREAEAAVDGDSRADFLRKAAVGGGGLLAGGALLGAALPDLADAKPSKKQDDAIAKGAIGGTAMAAAKVIASHEEAHVKFLKQGLGRKAVKKPKFDFGTATGDQNQFIATAITLEDTGVAAYAGQGPRLSQVRSSRPRCRSTRLRPGTRPRSGA